MVSAVYYIWACNKHGQTNTEVPLKKSRESLRLPGRHRRWSNHCVPAIRYGSGDKLQSFSDFAYWQYITLKPTNGFLTKFASISRHWGAGWGRGGWRRSPDINFTNQAALRTSEVGASLVPIGALKKAVIYKHHIFWPINMFTLTLQHISSNRTDWSASSEIWTVGIKICGNYRWGISGSAVIQWGSGITRGNEC